MFKFILALLLLPLIELYLLIQIGSGIGAGLTVLLTLGTAVLGVWLVRLQGVAAIMRAQVEMATGRPALSLLEGAVLCAAGILLLIPGFATDAAGFLMLIGPLRRFLLSRWFGQMERQDYRPESAGGRIIDVDYEETDGRK